MSGIVIGGIVAVWTVGGTLVGVAVGRSFARRSTDLHLSPRVSAVPNQRTFSRELTVIASAGPPEAEQGADPAPGDLRQVLGLPR